MKHIKKFNESEQFQSEETHMDEQPKFTLEQLEAAFMSARIVFNKQGRGSFNKLVTDAGYEPRFQDFQDWFTSELGSSYGDIAPESKDQDKWPLS